MEAKSHETLTYRFKIGQSASKGLRLPKEGQKLACRGSQVCYANFKCYSGCFHQS
jgi:hypothetical protein